MITRRAGRFYLHIYVISHSLRRDETKTVQVLKMKRIAITSAVVVIVAAFALAVGAADAVLAMTATTSSFRAAVVEFVPYGKFSQPAADVLSLNLAAYEHFAADAAAADADIVVFPEGALGWLFADGANR
jgi:hypothetical protein